MKQKWGNNSNLGGEDRGVLLYMHVLVFETSHEKDDEELPVTVAAVCTWQCHLLCFCQKALRWAPSQMGPRIHAMGPLP